MSQFHSRRYPLLFAALLLIAGLPAFASLENAISNEPLVPHQRHENIGETVTHFVQRSHYNHTAVDDALSSKVLDRYIESLDGNRMYLLESDIEFFDKNRYKLDDYVKSEPLDPVFEMFDVYRTRVRERYEYALGQLEHEPDFSVEEQFQFDRSDAPWATTTAQLDEIWRKRVKNDALRHILNDKSWDETREILSKRYQRLLRRMDQVTPDDVFEGFMNAFAHTLDPHSSYLSPRNSEEYRIQMSLSYFGIGASLQPDDDYVKVIGIIPGGPAAIDGKLRPNDLITGVGEGPEGDVVDVVGWRLEDVVDLIRGPGDTTVRLQILPADALPGSGEVIIPLTRGQVKLEEQAAKSQVIKLPWEGREWRIGVIDVPSFYRDYRALSNGDKDFTSTTRDVKRLIDELEEQGIDGLVMDLRGNGGGHLTEATALSGLFIDNGPVVQLRNANGRINRLDDPNPIAQVAYDGPLAVLVDRFSASASEIFAAAIQDYHRGVIIGQQTFGKGTVQNLYSLDQYMKPDKESEDGFGQLTLTIGKYYRVTGESTQHRGVNPDINLPSAIDAAEVGESVRDSALPWDTIKTARFAAGEPLDSTIRTLTADQEARSKSDPDYQWLLGGIQEFEEARAQDSVSLNIDDRRTEREQELERRLQRENERRKALQLEPLASLDDIDEDELPDVILQQAAGIVRDMAEMRSVKATPAQTAQMQPGQL
ncbi:MAG TPA: carboxy terminal-processing peptidase [Woeseiaceae bacterium]|nr:carboxy terminal-processing peptidase [Woeseiaceae bacterium]